MNSNQTRPQGRRQQRGGRRRHNDRNDRRDFSPREDRAPQAPQKRSLWQKILGFFTGGKTKAATPDRARRDDRANREQSVRREPELVEVTTPKLYVGNLSYDATEGDLFELFNGVGKVQNAEIITFRETEKSKGFGFVTMLTVDEAKRAVETLHDKPFMGRKLKVTGSKSDGPRG